MKIIKIESSGDIYKVTKTPNFIERLLGKKERVDKYRATGRTYSCGGGYVYVDQTGKQLGNIDGWGSDIREAIDRWRNSF